MLREIDRIALVLMPDGSYSAIDNLSIRQKQLLGAFNVPTDKLDAFATDINHRLVSPISSQVHLLPDSDGAKTKRRPGRPPKKKAAAVSDAPKRKPGRPKGSKNKKTLEREANGIAEQPKRRPGRPKGSKNKKTLERSADGG